MSQRVSPFQLNDPIKWSGLTTENHLGWMGMNDPILTSPLIHALEDENYGMEFDRFVMNFAQESISEDKEFDWLISGPDVKNVPLVDWYDESGNKPAKPGVGLTMFYMLFPERCFELTDTFATDSREIYQMRVTAEPIQKGVNWEYRVQLWGGDLTLFVPASELVVGKRYAKLYSPVEQTLSERGGTVSHTGYMRMRNRCSTIRMEAEVPGNLISRGDNAPKQAFYVVKDEKGKPKQMSTWLGKLEWDFNMQYKKQKAHLYMYSKYNKTSQNTYIQKGLSGYEIKMGGGFYEQVSPSNVHYITNWTLDQIVDILMTLSVGRLAMDKRNFILGMGEWGMKRFHELCEVRGIPFSYNNAGGRVTGSGNQLRFGGQYVKYGSVNGIEITVMHLPFLDDPEFNTERHPDGGLMSSYEILIMDIGTTNGKPNVVRMNIDNEPEIYFYVAGIRDPFSPKGSAGAPKMATSGKDGYKFGRKFTAGLKINNPTSIARIVPNYKRGD